MGKTVVITGASRGIGYATAAELARHGEDIESIALLSRSESALDEARAELAKIGADIAVRVFAVDLTSRENALDAVDRLSAAYDNVDVLINNAGYTNPVAFQSIEFEDFERTMMVNLYAPFTLIQELLRQGHRLQTIVNVASTAGITGRAGWLTYSASKAAVINMSDVLRQELAIYGTRVVCISPGRCATDLRRTLAPDEDPSTIMQPEHVGLVIRTLLSEAGQYVDSANLVVRK